MTRQARGTFNSANGWIDTGVAMAGTEYLYDNLMISSHNEAFTQYPQLAQKVTYDPDDSSWVIYHINPKAKFWDGSEVTAEDVKATFDAILTKGLVYIRHYLEEVDKVEVLDKHRVKFHFKSDTNKEIPLTVGQFPVFKKESIDKQFETVTLEPLIGSGPYQLDKIDAGRSVSYKRNPNYWGKDLMVNKGRYNFDTIKYIYYLNDEVAFEGFKAGQYTFREENKARNWATAYNFPAVQSGNVVKETIDKRTPTPMQGFVMNTRKPLFQDVRVRQALTYAYDFAWTNKSMFYGQYVQPLSYFYNSEMEAKGKPSPEEMAVINQLKPLIAKDQYQTVISDWKLPVSDGKGYNREGLLMARNKLLEAGFHYNNGKLFTKTGKPAKIEMLLTSGSALTRIYLPYVRNLRRLGFEVSVREVDRPQYYERLRNYDFDMTTAVYAQSMSPGAEQTAYWSSESAEQAGNRNYAGIKDPAIDKAIELLIASKNREEIVLYSKVLDRLLRAGYYLVPMNGKSNSTVAYWKQYKHAEHPLNQMDVDYWWVEE
ncbi:MAG: ABC transporter substrate-binding protein [Pseudomonadales bacterium]|nr:MAG: ABC transporter substrate-binding protein [Pseudomonadales bacterium]